MPPVLRSDGLDPRRSQTNVKFTGTLSQPTGHAGPTGGTKERNSGLESPRADVSFKGQPMRQTEVGRPASGPDLPYRENGLSVGPAVRKTPNAPSYAEPKG